MSGEIYSVCMKPASLTNGGLFTDTGVNERGVNERQSENDSEMKLLASVLSYQYRMKITNKKRDH